MKILICGVGKVGAALAKQLSREGHDLTLIDKDPYVLGSGVEAYDVISLRGNVASAAVLREAEVESAELLIAATGKDEVNLLCCMTAHTLNPKLHTIARIRDPEYREQAYAMRGVFGLSMIINPEMQAAAEIERLLKFPGFLKRETFAKGRMEIVELQVEADSKLCNVPLTELGRLVKCRVLVCSVLRGDSAIIPAGDFVVQAGDRLFVTATTNNLSALLRNLGYISHRARRVMLAGGGHVSYYLAKQLEKSGVAVQIFEYNRERCEELAELLPRVSVLCGDVSNHDLLESEGLEDCEAFVSLTGLDELNVVMSLFAHSRGVPQVITKMGRMGTNALLSSLPIGSVVCPKELCTDTIVQYVRAMQNQTGAALSVHLIADGQVEAAEFVVDEKTRFCGVPLRELKLRRGVLVVGISHAGSIAIPDGNSMFTKGDTVVVVSGEDRIIHQLNDIFE
ncbi:MAG: Trk system potassium transporter TrkA [Ruminococcaceae bacterium]|nr:Trk system potassium transporter TrkA [Oscillospiraceae bacterium]